MKTKKFNLWSEIDMDAFQLLINFFPILAALFIYQFKDSTGLIKISEADVSVVNTKGIENLELETLIYSDFVFYLFLWGIINLMHHSELVRKNYISLNKDQWTRKYFIGLSAGHLLVLFMLLIVYSVLKVIDLGIIDSKPETYGLVNMVIIIFLFLLAILRLITIYVKSKGFMKRQLKLRNLKNITTDLIAKDETVNIKVLK